MFRYHKPHIGTSTASRESCQVEHDDVKEERFLQHRTLHKNCTTDAQQRPQYIHPLHTVTNIVPGRRRASFE
jgi:hypothetical protein